MNAVARSLSDFRYDLFRVAVDLTEGKTETATLPLSSRIAVDQEAPPKILNFNFGADIEVVIYLGRSNRKTRNITDD
jgi:hypothetical protein